MEFSIDKKIKKVQRESTASRQKNPSDSLEWTVVIVIAHGKICKILTEADFAKWVK